VVLGAGAGSLAGALHSLPVRLETNVLHPEGMAASIRSAVAWALRSSCDALLVLCCDHHHVTTSHLERLLVAYRANRDVVASHCATGLCLPAVFHGTHYGRLAALTGERCAQVVLATTPHLARVEWPEGELLAA